MLKSMNQQWIKMKKHEQLWIKMKKHESAVDKNEIMNSATKKHESHMNGTCTCRPLEQACHWSVAITIFHFTAGI